MTLFLKAPVAELCRALVHKQHPVIKRPLVQPSVRNVMRGLQRFLQRFLEILLGPAPAGPPPLSDPFYER